MRVSPFILSFLKQCWLYNLLILSTVFIGFIISKILACFYPFFKDDVFMTTVPITTCPLRENTGVSLIKMTKTLQARWSLSGYSLYTLIHYVFSNRIHFSSSLQLLWHATLGFRVQIRLGLYPVFTISVFFLGYSPVLLSIIFKLVHPYNSWFSNLFTISKHLRKC